MTTDNLTLAVNHAINDLRLARARMGLLNPSMGLDAKRDAAWCEYGFKEDLNFSDFYKLYRRGGIAHGAVEKLIGSCWKTDPWVIEGDEQDEARDETPWERRLKPITTPKFWRQFAEADRRRLVGCFSALILRVRDSQAWDQPVRGKPALVGVIPAWASSLQPVDFDTEPHSDRYGLPKYWQYTQRNPDGSASQVKIHYDRIFILGDWTTEAIGFLEPAFNAFVSLEKVEGGSGESFLKNAARQVSVNFDKEVDFNNLASMYGVNVTELQEKFNEAAKEINRGNDQMLITQGATVAPLVSAVADPKPTYDVNLQTAAAAVDIPTKILVGMQTGERASSEDQKYFNARCQSRRVRELSFEAHDLVEHLMRIRIVDHVAEFTIMWDDLTDATQADKLANAKTMSEINSQALAMGEPVFRTDEIRAAAGYDADDAPDPLGEDDEDEDGNEGQATDPARE